MHRLRAVVGLVVAALALAWPAFAIAAPAAWSVQPPPSWVVPVEPGEATSDQAASNGRRYLLFDRQVKVGAQTVEQYIRWSRQITNEAGLHATSQVGIDFDPSYETLAIHSVTVHRGSETLQRLDATAVKIVQREPNLEQQIFDGRQSAVLFIDDLRVGDVVEYAFTRRGADPTLGGKLDEDFTFGAPEPIARVHARLLLPSGRRAHFRAHGPPIDEPKTTTRGDSTEYEWDLRNVKPFESDTWTPSWVSTFPWVQVTEFESWRDVAAWGARLFDPAAQGARTGAVADWVRRARNTASSDSDFVLAALRFVQDEVRYVGIETGMARRRPTDPAVVFERRYGDCKDKTALLVAMLRMGGVRAAPALVNSSRGRALDDSAPSPSLFDHVIARITSSSGTTLWADPTIALQGGGVERLEAGPYVHALPLAPETTALAKIPERTAERPSPKISDWFVVAAPGAKEETRLDAERVYEGDMADSMRASLKGKTLEQQTKDYLALYEQDFPAIHERAPLEIFDNRDTDVLRVVLHFALPDFWSGDEKDGRKRASIPSRLTDEALPRPTRSTRDGPVAVPFPLRVAHRIELKLPFDLPFTPEKISARSPAFEFAFESSYGTRNLEYTYRVTTLAPSVAAGELDGHLAQIDKARASLVRALWYRAPLQDGINWAGLVALLACAPLLVFGAYRAYRYDPRRPPRADVDPRLAGIGGWLVLLAIGIVGNPIGTASSLVKQSKVVLSLAQWRAFTTPELDTYSPALAVAMIVEQLFLVAFVAYGIVVALLFFKKRRSFPLHFTVYAVGLALFHVVDQAAVALLAPDSKNTTGAALIARSILWAGIWVAYVHNSKRCAATFVQRARRKARKPRAAAG